MGDVQYRQEADHDGRIPTVTEKLCKRWRSIGIPRGITQLKIMDNDAILGWMLVAGALSLITYLVLWSRRTINRIAERGLRSARQIVKELRGDR